MGMYDTIKVNVKCPHCGEINENSQTKDSECMLNTYEKNAKISEQFRYINAFDICVHCKKSYFIEFIINKYGVLTGKYKTIKDGR